MKLSLNVSLRQTLAPQLIQSLKLLQMPILRLEQTIRQELDINPMLEELEAVDEEQDKELEETDDENDDSEVEKIDWEDYLGDDMEYVPKSPREVRQEILDRGPVLQKTLYDHLHEQLSFARISQKDRALGEYIIGNIDERGYLCVSTEDMALELDFEQDRVERVLAVIQSFDPVGVGARSLQESLMLQLKDRGEEGTVQYRLVAELLQQLDRKSPLQMAKSLGVSVEDVQAALDQIKLLNPQPASGMFTRGAMPVVPDLAIERVGDSFVVLHNDRNIPRLRVNQGYRQLLKRGNATPQDTKEYVRGKLDQARWLLNAINQRRGTMIRVMEAIIQFQPEFFDKGTSFLKPLIMEQVADHVGMNVATISRVASDKYVQTPHGVYEIKYFFNAGVRQKSGEDLSKRMVKEQIGTMIKDENPEKPLSDQEIFQRLNAQGIEIARRTVSKYREELKLRPARFRKRVDGVQ
jgi:RNA polymerase sigma-54 factor